MTRLSGHGLSLDLPEGWDARVTQRRGQVTLHAASYPLPARDGEFGPGAIARMPRDGVFLALTEYRRALAGSRLYQRNGPPKRLPPGELSARAVLNARPGQVGLQRFFAAHGRPFSLYLVVGSARGRRHLAAQANVVLRTLSVERPGQAGG